MRKENFPANLDRKLNEIGFDLLKTPSPVRLTGYRVDLSSVNWLQYKGEGISIWLDYDMRGLYFRFAISANGSNFYLYESNCWDVDKFISDLQVHLDEGTFDYIDTFVNNVKPTPQLPKKPNLPPQIAVYRLEKSLIDKLRDNLSRFVKCTGGFELITPNVSFRIIKNSDHTDDIVLFIESSHQRTEITGRFVVGLHREIQEKVNKSLQEKIELLTVAVHSL